ncbi:cyclophilin-like fold protein [Actinoallomurus acaciae]|uniref:Cyclophilin-like fold protein n=1 Tax=Actinoallomurus acaciae TaxID=502577 RepID=A0ABV5Y8G6_9ACTN
MYPTVRCALARAAPAAALLLTVTACSSDTQDNPPAATSSPSERSAPMGIQVTLDGQPVGATLKDSPAARDFAELLPLTLDLTDFHSTERVADLPRRLTTDRAPEPAAAQVGDIAYYAPWGNLALFYQDGPAPSADLLILGHLNVHADQLGRATRITIESAS